MNLGQPNQKFFHTLVPISVIALVCGSLLAATHYFAQTPIQQQQKAYEIAQLEAVLGHNKFTIEPAGQSNNQSAKAFTLTENDKVVGELVQLSTYEGYNGEITFWLALQYSTNSIHEVIGVRVIYHKETPGLGDKLELGVSDWVTSFEGQSLNTASWDVKKYGGSFDQFSGATITPRAVVRRIANHLEATK